MAESEYTPTLTLNPTEAAVQEAPAAPFIKHNGPRFAPGPVQIVDKVRDFVDEKAAARCSAHFIRQ